MIGEVADGIMVHPLHSLAYLDEIVWPNLAEGCGRAGRSVEDMTVIVPVMTAVSDDERSLAEQHEKIRQRLAFYGSTPGYGAVFDASGWPGTGERLNDLMRAGDVTAMAQTITDAMAISGTWSDSPRALAEKYRGMSRASFATRLSSSGPRTPRRPSDGRTWSESSSSWPRPDARPRASGVGRPDDVVAHVLADPLHIRVVDLSIRSALRDSPVHAAGLGCGRSAAAEL